MSTDTSTTELLVPWRGLLPADVAEVLADSYSKEPADGAGMSVLPACQSPTLSDRIVCIQGYNLEQQKDACRKVLSQLQEALGTDAADEAFFVILVPTNAAAAVVGTRGQRVSALSETSGAKIEVSREVLPGLQAQPVTIKGALEQVVAGSAGVHQVLQELYDRGRLGAEHFGGATGSTERAQGSSSRLKPSPVVLCISMEAAGLLIGKQGQHVAELQRSSGARMRLVNNGMTVPGMRCGERLFEVDAPDAASRTAGVRAVFSALATADTSIVLLLPANAVGYVIGRGGQTVKEIMSRTGVEVLINQEGSAVEGTSAVNFRSPGQGQGQGNGSQAFGEAVLELIGKVDELREKLASGAVDGSSTRAGYAGRSTDTAPVAPLFSSGVSQARTGAIPRAAPLENWPVKTKSEQALLDGIQASGVLNHELTIQVPRGVFEHLDVDDLELRSGARLEVISEDADQQLLVSAVGQRVSTSLAALYLQEAMATVAGRGRGTR